MKKSCGKIHMSVSKIIIILLMTLIFGSIWYCRYIDILEQKLNRNIGLLIIVLFALIYNFLGRIYEAFQIDMYSVKEIRYSQMLTLLLSDSIMFLSTIVLVKNWKELLPWLVILPMQIVVLNIWVFISNKVYDNLNPSKKTAVLYSDIRDKAYLENVGNVSRRFQIQKWVCVSGNIKDVLSDLDEIQVVFLRGLSSSQRNKVLKHCIANNIEVYQYPKIGDVIMTGAEQLHMFHEPVMYSCRYNPSWGYVCVKRILDIMVAMLGILILAPVFLITALAIKCYDGGAVIYKQIRLTQNGRLFEIYKFRSMKVDAEKDGVAKLAEKEDNRITPVGKIIRAVRIDELPQLFNVLKGDMSLVGPRPERPEIAETYMQEMPEFVLRLQVKAGITGYAQVYGKYSTLPYDKLQMDLLYISRPSIYVDFKLLLATVKVLFMKESSEGINKNNSENKMINL